MEVEKCYRPKTDPNFKGNRNRNRNSTMGRDNAMIDNTSTVNQDLGFEAMVI